MSCYFPIRAIKLGTKPDGTAIIKILSDKARPDWDIRYLKKRFSERNVLLLPCGHCLGCKFDKAKDWATRVYCESLYHQKSCFLTLTYDDKHLPKTQKKNKELLKEFIKKLRNRGEEIRYFGCGEYGETTRRIHGHIILFGYIPDDLELFSKNSKGDVLYTSESLSSIWSNGHVLVGEVSYASAGYVARYTTKKIDDDDSFLICSTKPGIGLQYCLDNSKELIDTGFVYGDFGDDFKAPLPRYFEKVLSKLYPSEWDKLVEDRLHRVKILEDNSKINYKMTYTEELKLHDAEILDQKLSRFHRR